MADDTATTTGEPGEADEAGLTEPKIQPAGEATAVATDDVETDDLETDDTEAAEQVDAAVDEADAEEVAPKSPMSHLRLMTIFGLVSLLAVSGLAGWLGYRAYESHRADTARAKFLTVGKDAAVNLTTIDFEHVDQQVQHIVDSATGTFYDDFERRAQPFSQVVKELKSRAVGTVNEAGIESASDNDGKVLVAVTVKTSITGQPDQPIKAWRMRISVQKIGDDLKVSNVEFVA